jgi:hypothetical protein
VLRERAVLRSDEAAPVVRGFAREFGAAQAMLEKDLGSDLRGVLEPGRAIGGSDAFAVELRPQTRRLWRYD